VWLMLYRCAGNRVFFNNQTTLQLADFLGTMPKAVRWQVWISASWSYVLRYLSYLSKWGQQFYEASFTFSRAVVMGKGGLC